MENWSRPPKARSNDVCHAGEHRKLEVAASREPLLVSGPNDRTKMGWQPGTQGVGVCVGGSKEDRPDGGLRRSH